MTRLFARRLITLWLVCVLATLPFALSSHQPEAVLIGAGVSWILVGCALVWLRSDG